MGLFDNGKITVEKTIKAIQATDYVYKDRLNDFDYQPYIVKFKSEEMLSKILLRISKTNIFYADVMSQICKIYTLICIDRTPAEEKSIFWGLFDVYLNNNELFINKNNLEKTLSAFDDKRMVLEFFDFLGSTNELARNNALHKNLGWNYLTDDYIKNISLIIDYVINARQYYVDDRALLSSVMNLIKSIDPFILISGTPYEVEDIINKKLDEARKSNGIYNIDEDTLAELDDKLQSIIDEGNRLDGLIISSEILSKSLDCQINNVQKGIISMKIRTLDELKTKAKEILENFNVKYLELLNQQRESLINEKDTIVDIVNEELEKKKEELEAKLREIYNETSSSIQSLKEFIEKYEEIKKILEEFKNDKELAKKLETFEHIIENESKIKQRSSNSTIIPRQNDTNISFSNILLPNNSRQLDITTNYYFDRTIQFNERFNKLMELKQKDIKENGTIYHEKFDDVLKIIMQGNTPYMWGPSGCGKTYMIENQIAKLLGINIVTNGYVLYEENILGYNNAGTGEYVPSNFYRCYLFGDIIFFDELDNGLSNATIVLNRFIGNENSSYTFPNGATINKHPNFRIITAGNTKGSGHTFAHNVRQKMDESVLQRLTPIEINYDNRIEEKILKDHKDWFNFAVNFRKAIERVQSPDGEDVNTIGTFTTRDAEKIKRYLDDKCFNDEQIMEYEIIGTKDRDYLEKINKYMEDQMNEEEFNDGGKNLLEIFRKVKEKKCKAR